MGEKEDKEKAEKLAAAKKRVAQLQKKKKAAAEKSGKSSKEDTPKSPTKADSAQPEDAEDTTEPALEDRNTKDAEAQPHDEESAAALSAVADEDPDEAMFNDAIKAATTTTATTADESDEDGAPADISNAKARSPRMRQPSLSIQSKLRSTSFRSTPANGPLSPSFPVISPDGESVPDIYRKQAARLEELERENKMLRKETEEGDVRWRKSEEELERLRENEVERINSGSGGSSEKEIERLKAEIAALRRARAGSMSKSGRSGSIPEVSASLVSEQLMATRKELDIKDATISDMGLEISKLRTQISSQMAGCETHGEQISALQAELDRAETSARKVGVELGDAKRALERASERAVREGTEKTSASTKLRSLEKEVEVLTGERDEAVKAKAKVESKVEVMARLQRESEERWKKKLETVDRETKRLRDEKVRRVGRGGDGVEGDDGGPGLDELEDEERGRLEGRVRELEGEVFELRRGVWKEKRDIIGGDSGPGQLERPSFEVEGFDEVDLSGGLPSRRTSHGRLLHQHQQPTQQQKHSGFSQVLTSGLAAFRATPDHTHSHTHQNRPRNDSLLQDFDDDDTDGFDEAAFAQAQREEEARKMVAHVREVKRGLKGWAGYRLDLVEVRRGLGSGDAGGGWFGEIFDV